MKILPRTEVVDEVIGVRVRVPKFSTHTEWKEEISFGKGKRRVIIPAHIMNGMVVTSGEKKVVVNRYFYVQPYEAGRKVVFRVIFRRKTLKDGRQFLLIDYEPMGKAILAEFKLKFNQLKPRVLIPGFERGINIVPLFN